MELDEVLLISMLVSSLNSPVYISVPVLDAAVVDLFLGRLDAYLAVALRGNDWGFFNFKRDLYRLRLSDQLPARGLSLELGPVKWRFFWARIGNGLYVASQPQVLEDLVAMHSGNTTPAVHSGAEETTGHALIRIRPEHWQRVLPSYQLGWAENNREACLLNLGPLSNVSRAVPGPSAQSTSHSEHVHNLAAQLYGTRFYCPDGGQYLISNDGQQVTCTVHGSQEAPHQRNAPAPDSPVGRQLAQFANLSVTLTFLEDGLRAVLTLDRKRE